MAHTLWGAALEKGSLRTWSLWDGTSEPGYIFLVPRRPSPGADLNIRPVSCSPAWPSGHPSAWPAVISGPQGLETKNPPCLLGGPVLTLRPRGPEI